MKRIIVCDDEPHIVEGLRHLLRSPERIIEATSSGKEALARIAEGIPDLLIVDIMMPEMSGLEVIATLRADEATKNLPIIILTARGQAQDAVMAQELWEATVMTKPFHPRMLRELVDKTIEAAQCLQRSST
jgi:two-component system phosphate regulon response regulator PhoB